MKTTPESLCVRLTFTTPLLGGISDDEHPEKMLFHREEGEPCLPSYNVKGFFKEACRVLRKTSGTSSDVRITYVNQEGDRIRANIFRVIDSMISVRPRHLIMNLPNNHPALSVIDRKVTMTSTGGRRHATIQWETAPIGTQITFEVECMVPEHLEVVIEWLDSGEYHGLGPARNSGMGRFSYEILDGAAEKPEYDEYDPNEFQDYLTGVTQ